MSSKPIVFRYPIQIPRITVSNDLVNQKIFFSLTLRHKPSKMLYECGFKKKLLEVMIMEEFIDESFFIDDPKSKEPSQIELKTTGFERTFNERLVGSVTKIIEPVSSQNPLENLVELFASQPDLEAIPIESNNKVIGIIDKEQTKELTNSFFKRFVAKDCGDYIKKTPFVLNTRDFLEIILPKVVSASKEYEIKHFVVLLNNRDFYGIVSLEDIRTKIEELRVQDLEKAQSIQQYMLPSSDDLTALPFKVQIWNRMANLVGGDFFVAQKISANSYLAGVFDVSGKNVSAALLTVTIGSFFEMLKTFSKKKITAYSLATMLDSFLESIIPVGNFITGAICHIDMEEKHITIVNCGHDDVYALINNDDNKVKFATLSPTLPPFGMNSIADELKKTGKGGYKLTMQKGLQINLFSDGLPDMQDDEGTRFDTENTKNFFLDVYTKDPKEFSTFVDSTVKEWIADSMLPDDITIMNIRF